MMEITPYPSVHRAKVERRLDLQYEKDLAQLLSQASNFGKGLKRQLIRFDPSRPQNRHPFDNIAVSVHKHSKDGRLVEYKTQLAVRQRERLQARYVPLTLLAIPRELRQAILLDVFDSAVLRSIVTSFDDINAYQKKARKLANISVRAGCMIRLGDVGSDTELYSEADDAWNPVSPEPWGTNSQHQIFPEPVTPVRNRTLQRQIQQQDAKYIHGTASNLLKIWPQISDDIEFCKKKALEEFGHEKWAIANIASKHAERVGDDVQGVEKIPGILSRGEIVHPMWSHEANTKIKKIHKYEGPLE
jgi:hypothetical protein